MPEVQPVESAIRRADALRRDRSARRFKCAVAVPRPAESGLRLIQCIRHATIRPVARRPYSDLRP
jgi:hypothetical protein